MAATSQVILRELEGIAAWYTSDPSSSTRSRPPPAARYVSPNAVIVSAPLASLVCTSNGAESPQDNTCRFSAIVTSSVLRRHRPPELPSYLRACSSYAVTLGLFPIALHSAHPGDTAAVVPRGWPSVDVDCSIMITANVSGASSAASDVVKVFPVTAVRASAHRSFAPLLLHGDFPDGFTIQIVSRNSWLEDANAASTTTAFVLCWVATSPVTDERAFSWVGDWVLTRSQPAPAKQSHVDEHKATRRQLCPQDRSCTKLTNPLHMRMVMHTCRRPHPCVLEHDAKHAAEFLHLDPAEEAAEKEPPAAAASSCSIDAARGTTVRTTGVWVDVTDPWVLRPPRSLISGGGTDTLSAKPPEKGIAQRRDDPRSQSHPAHAPLHSAAPQATSLFSSDESEQESEGNGPSRHVSATTSSRLEDVPVAVTEVRVSLRCPLSFTLMRCPVKGRRCAHDQCFDLLSHLMSCSRWSAWNCPVCDGPAYALDLVQSAVVLEALVALRARPHDAVDAILLAPDQPSSWRFAEVNATDDSDASHDEERLEAPQPVAL